MSYVPPHLRNKKKHEESVSTKDEFPSLGTTKTKTAFLPTRSFATLASEWSEEADIQKQKEEYKKEIETRELRKQQAEMRNIVKFNNMAYTVDESYPEENTVLYPSSSDDWTTVTHKKLKRELTIEEKLERDAIHEEEEKRLEEEDSMWVSNSHDDWDYRDRRVI